jgi:YD repeat-containing protein
MEWFKNKANKIEKAAKNLSKAGLLTATMFTAQEAASQTTHVTHTPDGKTITQTNIHGKNTPGDQINTVGYHISPEDFKLPPVAHQDNDSDNDGAFMPDLLLKDPVKWQEMLKQKIQNGSHDTNGNNVGRNITNTTIVNGQLVSKTITTPDGTTTTYDSQGRVTSITHVK